jgi:hypothetical protein
MQKNQAEEMKKEEFKGSSSKGNLGVGANTKRGLRKTFK